MDKNSLKKYSLIVIIFLSSLIVISMVLLEVTSTEKNLPPIITKFNNVKQIFCYPSMAKCLFIYKQDNYLLENNIDINEAPEITYVFKVTEEPSYAVKTQYYVEFIPKAVFKSITVIRKVEYTFFINDSDKIEPIYKETR